MQPITAPSGDQQEELLKKIYKQYEIDPTKLQYIECHGMWEFFNVSDLFKHSL